MMAPLTAYNIAHHARAIKVKHFALGGPWYLNGVQLLEPDHIET